MTKQIFKTFCVLSLLMFAASAEAVPYKVCKTVSGACTYRCPYYAGEACSLTRGQTCAADVVVKIYHGTTRPDITLAFVIDPSITEYQSYTPLYCKDVGTSHAAGETFDERVDRLFGRRHHRPPVVERRMIPAGGIQAVQ